MRFTIEEFLSKLPQPANETWKDGVYFTTAFQRESVSLEFFAPRGTDYQTSHDEDEFYFIVRGAGELIVESDRFTCAVGDAFFVPKRVQHHFENFTADFATWAVFY